MSSLQKRGNSWRLVLETTRHSGRKRQFVRLGSGLSRREAQAKAAKVLAAYASGEHVDPTRETFAQFVERWQRDWATLNVSPKTAERYGELLRAAFPHLGGIAIQKLNAGDLARCYSQFPHWSPRTRKHLHRVLSLVLRCATQWGVIVRNPAGLVDAPKVEETEAVALPATEIQKILEKLRGRMLGTIAGLALATGLRRGEICGLQWADIDFDSAVLKVERAIEQTAASTRTRSPKTKYGRRHVKLAPSTVELLREHRRRQIEQRLKLGIGGKLSDDDWIFANWDGSLRPPRALTKEWSDAMKRLGVKASFHSLRHTHASELLRAGVDVVNVSRRLGHGSAAITLRIYAHVLRPNDDRIAQVVEAAIYTKGDDDDRAGAAIKAALTGRDQLKQV